MSVTSNSRKNADINHAKDLSIEEEKNVYAVGKFVERRDRPTGTYYKVRLYGYRPQDDAVGVPSTSFINCRMPTGEDDINTSKSLPGKERTERREVFTYKNGKQEDDNKKKHNHNLPTFAQTTLPIEVIR